MRLAVPQGNPTLVLRPPPAWRWWKNPHLHFIVQGVSNDIVDGTAARLLAGRCGPYITTWRGRRADPTAAPGWRLPFHVPRRSRPAPAWAVVNRLSSKSYSGSPRSGQALFDQPGAGGPDRRSAIRPAGRRREPGLRARVRGADRRGCRPSHQGHANRIPDATSLGSEPQRTLLTSQDGV